MTIRKITTLYPAMMVLAVLGLTACSAEQKPAAGTPEELLAAEGDWTLVEEEQLPDPAQAHMKTRQQVNAGDTSAKRSYTQDANAANVNEDVHFRVLRLERQMSALQGDFDRILPPMADKAEADARFSQAAREVQAGRGNAPLPPPLPDAEPKGMKIEPEPLKSKPAAQAQPVPMPVKAVNASGPAQVTKVRLGEHPGKTRLVLDVSKAASFSADLDSSENLLVVEIKGAGWAAPEQSSFARHPLIKSYNAQKTEEGTRLVIALAKPAKLISKMSLSPNDTYSAHRIVLDLALL